MPAPAHPWYGLVQLSGGSHEPDCLFINIGCLHAGCRAQQVMVDVRYWALSGRSRGAPQSQFLTDAVDKVSDA
jgi:hypothetical protein